MRFKHITSYFLVTLSMVILLTAGVSGQESTTYSWSDSINKGDKFVWKMDSIIENHEYLNGENYTLSTLQVNSTTSQFNDTATSTVTITDMTSTNDETTTVIETTTETGGYYDKITNGSLITIEVLKDLNALNLEDPLFDNEWEGESSPTYGYFDYRIDGEIYYYLFPVYIMIIPVKVHNGYADNFFEHQLKLDDEGEFGDFENLGIENGVFYLKADQIYHDNFSRSESVIDVRWDIKTGVMLSFEEVSHYSDEYFVSYSEMKFSFESINDQTPDVELELPVSMFSIVSILLVPILRKIRKNS
ncbi:MAG: hypothetical protein GPJ54_01375 [Candidatus Heimdallarchaeota archaeon]|nr:hypothetical protein [Candidatus Heimdallarchaeota archaeon]